MSAKHLALYEVAEPQVEQPKAARKLPRDTRVANAARAYVSLVHERQQTCSGYCAMTVGTCLACRKEAKALHELAQVIASG